MSMIFDSDNAPPDHAVARGRNLLIGIMITPLSSQVGKRKAETHFVPKSVTTALMTYGSHASSRAY
jgi:hypothetical protein